MALVFPLPVADFWDGLRVQDTQFYAPAPMESSEDAGGAIYTADLGVRLWQGRISITQHYHGVIGQTEAMIARLAQSGASFLAYDKRAPYPAADPTGAIIGVATPAIHTLTADASEIGLTGLPAGYVITPGDYMSFTYGLSPVRYGLHRVVMGGVASGAGITGLLQVTPFIRPGAVAGAAVQLVRARCKALIVPGGYKPSTGGVGLVSTGLNFEFMQTLK